MNAQTLTIHDLAREAASWFETATRGDDPDATYVRTKTGRPRWLEDLVYTAHNDMLPDDWRYATISDALDHLSDDEADPDEGHEFADSAVDVYSGARLAWLASNLIRVGYVDEACDEFGNGKNEDGIVSMIGLGQYAEALEVWDSVVSSLRSRLDAIESDEA